MAEELKMAQASPQPASTTGVPGIPMAAKVVEKKNIFSEMFAAKKAPVVIVKKDNPLEAPKKAKPGTIVLKVSLGIFVIIAGFFFTQLSTSFTILGTNTAQKNALAKVQVTNLQAEITMEKHLNAVLLLEKYSKFGDEYFYYLKQSTSEYVSENKKTEYKTKVDSIKPQMKEIVAALQTDLGDVITEEQRQLTVQKITEAIDLLKAKTGQADEQSILSDIQDLESTRKILVDDSFKSIINSTDSEKATNDDLEKILTAYNTINQSVASLISSIESKRISWSTYLVGAEEIAKDIDPLFNTEFKGNMTIQSLDFSSDASTMSVTGETETADTKNFTLISDLVDAFNASKIFKDAEQRSFSKNESGDEEAANYSASFQLTISLETETQ